MDISSPITSDEEYLSPLEEGLDFGGPEPRQSIDVRFRCPPAFLVRYVTSQILTELLAYNKILFFLSIGFLIIVLRAPKTSCVVTKWTSLFVLLVFQATVSDQAVIEGQEVTMSVRISGQPKPLLYW